MSVKRSHFLLILPLFLICFVSPAHSRQSNLVSQEEYYIQQGKDYYAKGDLVRAKAMFELALNENPQNALARAYITKIESSMAEEGVKASIPDVTKIYNEAKIAFINGDYKRAVALFEEVLSYIPNHQYALKYLEKARSRLKKTYDYQMEEPMDLEEWDETPPEGVEDPSILRTKLKMALLSLQEELLKYFQTLSSLKDQQDALMKKYLEEKERRVRELEARVRSQSELVEKLSEERLRLQSELARINEEIMLLERRLSSAFYERTGKRLNWDEILEIERREAELSKEEERLTQRLRQELELQKAIQEELKKIEDRLRLQGVEKEKLASDIEKLGDLESLKKRPIKEIEPNQKKQVSYSRLKTLYQEGISAYKRGDYDEAVEKLSRVVEEGSGTRIAKKAEVWLKKSREKRKEREVLAKVEEEKEKKKLDLFYSAQDAYFNGNFARAEELCEKVLEIDPHFRPALELKKLSRISMEEEEEKKKKREEGEAVSTGRGTESKMDLRDRVKRLERLAEEKRRRYLEEKLNQIRSLVEAGDYDRAEELLVRLIRLYPDDPSLGKYLSRIREEKKQREFEKKMEEINELIDRGEYILAEEQLKSLIRDYPEKKKELSLLRGELNKLLLEPYLAQVDSLVEQGDDTSLEKALKLIGQLRARFPRDKRLLSYERHIRNLIFNRKKEQERIRLARERTLRALKREVLSRSRLLSPDPSLTKKVHLAQEEYRRDFYQTTIELVKKALSMDALERAEDLLALLDNVPGDLLPTVKKLKKELAEKKLEREFSKHIEMARSALKVYDFETAREEVEKAKQICPKCKKRLKDVLGEMEERIKFYKVQQGLKTAQIYLQNGDFVSAKIVVKDILKTVDPGNKYAKEMLKQIEKAESLYYADVKLRQGIMALKAGDYESATRLAKEGLRLNSKSRDLWDLYRKAKARWKTEILRRKSLLHQIEEEAAQKRRMRLAAREVEHKDLEYTHKVNLVEADVQGMLSQAKRLFEEQRFDRAIALCKKILEYDPENSQARALLDLIMLSQEEIEKKKTKGKSLEETQVSSESEAVSEKKARQGNEVGERVAKGSRKDSKPLKRQEPAPSSRAAPMREKSSQRLSRLHRQTMRKLNRFLRGKAIQSLKECDRREKERQHLQKSITRELESLYRLEREKEERLARIHSLTLDLLSQEVRRKAEEESRREKWISEKVRDAVKKLGETQKRELIERYLALARGSLKEGDFESALNYIREAYKISPQERRLKTLKRKVLRARAREVERLVREREKKERKYAEARERMRKEMEKEIQGRSALLARQIDTLNQNLENELWLLSKIQSEKELNEKIKNLSRLLAEGENRWSLISEAERLLTDLRNCPDLTQDQKRKLSKLEKKYERLRSLIEEKKAQEKKAIEERLANLRLAEGVTQTDIPNKQDLVSGMIQKAKEALYQGDYQKVLKIAEDILDLDPENGEAVKLSQKAREMIKKEREVREKQLELETQKYPSVREIYELAKKNYDQGNYAKARELFRKVYQEEKRLGISYYSPYAREYLDLIKEREKDIETLNKEKETEELKTRIVEKLYEDAERFERQGKYASAISVYENILFLFPNDKRAKEKLFAVKEKMFQREKEDLQRRLDEQDQKMVEKVMESGLVPLDQKKKKIDLAERRKKRLINLPPIKKKLQQRISANFEDVPLVDVLRFFAKQTGINIIPSASVLSQDYKVTIDITDMPLESALKYLLKSYNLTYQIDEDAVWITTPDQLEKEPMETKVYHLNKGIGLYSKFTLTTSGSVDLGSGASVSEVKTLKDILQEAVDWPSGSKLVLDERTGALIVTNTPANIKKIDEILWNLDVTPVQVLIEAKFLEVDVTDLKEIGVEWKIANEDWAVDSKDGGIKHGVGKDSGFSYPDFANASSGLNLTYKGVLTKPQFQAVLHALMQSQNTRTLSSPRVTTLNNQTATIKVVDEWIYPTRYEFQIVQFDLNGDGDYDDAGETRYENVPTDFVKRDVGIILRVTPSVGEDLKTISLSLLPEVSDATKNYFEYTGGVSLPKFTSRTLSTNVVVENTDTVVLGGLIKENRTKVLTKVPLLGDIPILGQMFRKTSDEINRRNLLIFVTATIIDPEGDTLVSE